MSSAMIFQERIRTAAINTSLMWMFKIISAILILISQVSSSPAKLDLHIID